MIIFFHYNGKKFSTFKEKLEIEISIYLNTESREVDGTNYFGFYVWSNRNRRMYAITSPEIKNMMIHDRYTDKRNI